jgi:hypothetical protein
MSERTPRRPSKTTSIGASWSPVAPSSDPFVPIVRSPGSGLLLELLGGPLAGQSAFMRDSRWALWVAGDQFTLFTVGALDRPQPTTAQSMLGHYAFSHRDEAYVWVLAEERGG